MDTYDLQSLYHLFYVHKAYSTLFWAISASLFSGNRHWGAAGADGIGCQVISANLRKGGSQHNSYHSYSIDQTYANNLECRVHICNQDPAPISMERTTLFPS